MKQVNISRVSGNFTKQATADTASELLNSSSHLVEWSADSHTNALLVEYRKPLFQLHKAIADELQQHTIQDQIKKLAAAAKQHSGDGGILQSVSFAVVLTAPAKDNNGKAIITQNMLRVVALPKFTEIGAFAEGKGLKDIKETYNAAKAAAKKALDDAHALLSITSVNTPLWAKVAPVLAAKKFASGIIAPLTVLVADTKAAAEAGKKPRHEFCTLGNFALGFQSGFYLFSRGFGRGNVEKIHNLLIGEPKQQEQSQESAAKPSVKLRAIEAANIEQVATKPAKAAKAAKKTAEAIA